MNQPKRSVVLLSGGLDSAANLALCQEEDETVLALTFDYGQKAAPREIDAAQKLCAHYKVEHRVVELPWFHDFSVGRSGKGSALTGSTTLLPELRPDQLDSLEPTHASAQAVWVPNRNGIFINIAAGYAEALEAEQVIVGFNSEEAVTFPDNSIPYMEQATKALAYSTALGPKSIRVWSYTAHMNKCEIVTRLKDLHSVGKSFPFENVWSCYQGGAQPCRKCESCLRFERATQGMGLSIFLEKGALGTRHA